MHGNGAEPHRRRHNRFDHSINVALLALRYAFHRDLSLRECRTISAAALLHDIGHGPLSHTLEPTFRRLFEIDHHDAGRAIILGNSPLGADIPRVFSSHGVDADEVLALLAGQDNSRHAFLFSSPINIDTIEAVARCCLFAGNRRSLSPTQFVDAIATSDAFPTDSADCFWSLKATIYQTLIHSRIGRAADALAQHYMMASAGRFRACDFYLDDHQLRREHPQLFSLLEQIRERCFFSDGLGPDVFKKEIEVAERSFTVNRFVTVDSPGDLELRYTQNKERRRTSIGSLVGLACTAKRSATSTDLEFSPEDGVP